MGSNGPVSELPFKAAKSFVDNYYNLAEFWVHTNWSFKEYKVLQLLIIILFRTGDDNIGENQGEIGWIYQVACTKWLASSGIIIVVLDNQLHCCKTSAVGGNIRSLSDTNVHLTCLGIWAGGM